MQTFEEGWMRLYEKGIRFLENYIETQFVDQHETSTSVVTQSKSCDQTIECHTRHKNVFTHAVFMELYSIVYDMTAQDYDSAWAQQLYLRRQQTLETYVKKKTIPVLHSAKHTPGFLQHFLLEWEKYNFLNIWTQKIFSYLDRFYIRAANEKPLKKAGYSIFEEKVFNILDDTLRDHLIESVNERRLGKRHSDTLVPAVIQLYILLDHENLQLYRTKLEQYLFPTTKLYYTKLSALWLDTCSFPEYIVNVQQALFNETEMAHQWFHPSTELKLIEIVKKVLLANRLDALLEMPTSLPYLFQKNCLEDLRLTYDLLSLMETGFNRLASSFRTFLSDKCHHVIHQWAWVFGEKELGTPQMTDHALKGSAPFPDTPEFSASMEELLALYEYAWSFVDSCFRKDVLFQKTLQQAFEDSINKPVGCYSMAALLCCYCDHLLQKTSLVLSDTMLKRKLSLVMQFFTCIQDKDLFVDLFRNQLAQRILNHTSRSLESEKLMAHKLEIACGSQLTSKLKGILADCEASLKMEKEFWIYVEQLASKDAKTSALLMTRHFHPFVLTPAFWPTAPLHTLNIPPPLSIPVKYFSTFYTEHQTSHRRLTWSYLQDTVFMETSLKNSTCHIVCNTLHACILLLFNDKVQLDLPTMSSILKFDRVLTQKHVTCLLGAQLLVKSSEMENGDTIYTVNESLEAPPEFTIRVEHPAQEEIKLNGETQEDRSIAIEAAMVRVMKHQKCMTHSDLVNETLKQLVHFKPDRSIMDEKIASLIDREFFKTTSNSLEYVYVP